MAEEEKEPPVQVAQANLLSSTVPPRHTKRTHEEAGGLVVISDKRLGIIMNKWERYHINLLWSPPSSGKTTLASVLKAHLNKQNYTVHSISFTHWIHDDYPDLLNNGMAFDNFWKSQIGCTWDQCISDCKTPTFVIIDEAQVLYGGAQYYFWNVLKSLVDYPQENLYILLLSVYDGRPTPMDFVHALGLESLRLTTSEYQEVVKAFIEYNKTDDEQTLVFPDEVLEALYNATYGHPHLVIQSLEFLQEQHRRGHNLLTSLVSANYLTMVMGTRVFDWLKDWDPTPDDIEFLMIAYGNIDSDSTFSVDVRLESWNSLQKFVRSGLITNAKAGRYQFAAPLVRIIMGQLLYTSRLSLIPSSNDFEEFLRLSIERMKPSELRKSLGHGKKEYSRLLERAWQKEWQMAACSALPSQYTISPDVGSVFGLSSYLDFYINGNLKWGVKLMQEGSKMSDHVERFTSTGRYPNVPLTCWAIIDFRHHSLIPDSNNLEPDVWYAIYAEDYSTMNIMRRGKEDMVVILRGDEF